MKVISAIVEAQKELQQPQAQLLPTQAPADEADAEMVGDFDEIAGAVQTFDDATSLLDPDDAALEDMQGLLQKYKDHWSPQLAAKLWRSLAAFAAEHAVAGALEAAGAPLAA